MKLGNVYLQDGKPPSNIVQTPSIIFKNSASRHPQLWKMALQKLSLSVTDASQLQLSYISYEHMEARASEHGYKYYSFLNRISPNP